MSAAQLVGLAIRASIFLIVFGLGLRASRADAFYLFSRPGRLVRSLLAMNVIMPLVAIGLALAFNFHHAVRIALVTLALSPVPPILPKKELKAGGRGSYAVGLLVATAVLSIVFIPLAGHVLRLFFEAGGPGMPPTDLAWMVANTVLLPVAAGIVVRGLAPALAERFADPIQTGATILLLLGGLLLLLNAWRAAWALIGNGHALVITAFVAIGLLVGHLLGGPGPEDRTVLGLSTASRHPGVAMALAGTAFPDEKLVVGAILIYLLISTIVPIPYLKWARRQRPAPLGGEGRVRG